MHHSLTRIRYARYSTAGFHQLSIRYTRDASVKFNATPPAFKLTKKTVTWTLFTARPLSASFTPKQEHDTH